ncbi:MAG: ribonuclease HII [Chloroflexota bacterium]|nr:ribonuclease HII [Chloroflexota bacterium]
MSPRKRFDRSLLPERPDLTFERNLWDEGLCFVAGVDEAGRGALAGPVAAGAVVLPSDFSNLAERLKGVKDSKVMTAKDRDVWALAIKDIAVDWGVGFASADEIDRIGIVPATYLAVKHALAQVKCSVEHILVDYLTLPEVRVAQTPLVKGDARSLSIASAAVLAKTSRDALLVQMDEEFPGYGFASNKGYATKAHRTSIRKLGPCEQHRRSFSPIMAYYSLFPPDQLKNK